MKLSVSGTEQAKEKYSQLWGFYVRGFIRWKHCQKCFRGSRAEGIDRNMADADITLDHPMDYFYLCGVAAGPYSERGTKNLHLAVRPKAGSRARIQSAYGPVFTIEDAEAIDIQNPLPVTPDLPQIYATCKNFRFAAQMYPTTVLGPGAKP